MADPLSILGDDDPDDYPTDAFRVNKSFSGHYDVWRQKEEMQKLKDLKSNMSDSSSESESEDEPVIEKDFLKALSLLKSDDPMIYGEDVELFKEGGQEEVKKKPKIKKEKPMLMKDYERELVLKRNGELSDEEYHVNDEDQMPIAQEEVRQRKAELPTLMADDSEDEDLFQEKTKGRVEEEKEEAEYLQFLKGEKEEVKEDVKELKFLHKYWNDPKLDQDEKFLRDYILNEKFVVKDKSGMNLNYGSEILEDMEMLSEDEKVVQQQEQFEHKYNFRFEEPDTEFIKRYPRTIGDSLRREDTRRKMKREEYADRKKREKDQKREELKRLKALKRKEIEEKFHKLKEVSGQDELNFDEEDMESDFDPDKHDRKMKELFNDDYYTVAEEQKPEFEYDEDLDDEKWDLWTREQGGSKGKSNKTDDNDDDNFSGEDAIEEVNAKQQFEQEMVDSTRVGRKRGHKKSLFAKIVSQPKPVYDPDGKSFDDYLDEYYKMDFEDVVGDLPVRFKYRKVVPNDFGLSVDEILTADDKELNQWCSVKKTCQYRHEDEENYDVQAFQRKAQNTVVKQKVLSSLYSLPNEEEETPISTAETKVGGKKSKKRGKKKKKNAAVSEEDKGKEILAPEIEVEETTVIDTNQSVESDANNVNLKSKKKKKKKSKNLQQESSFASSSSQVVEDSTVSTEEPINTSSDVAIAIGSESLNKKSKRKRKKAKANTSGDFEISNLEDSRNGNDLQLNNSAKKEYPSQNKADSYNLDTKTLNENGSKITNKTKRKLEDSMDISNLDNEHVKKKKKGVEHDSNKMQNQNSFETINPTTEETTTNVSQPTKKPKKKKKKKSKNSQDFSSRKPYNQDFSNKHFSSGSKMQSKVPEADKKLALPNSRLASYGLNPKQFKNSIIYYK